MYPDRHAQSALPAEEFAYAGHAEQFHDPTALLYVPASHATHASPSAPVNPTGHWHSTLPEEESELAGHVSHAAVPTTLLNVPASHALHGSPSKDAVYPAVHLQSASSSLPSDDTVFEGHSAQYG